MTTNMHFLDFPLAEEFLIIHTIRHLGFWTLTQTKIWDAVSHESVLLYYINLQQLSDSFGDCRSYWMRLSVIRVVHMKSVASLMKPYYSFEHYTVQSDDSLAIIEHILSFTISAFVVDCIKQLLLSQS